MKRLLCVMLLILAACTPEDDFPLPTHAVLPDIQTLTFWEAQQGTFSAAGEVDEWQFFGEAGSNIRLAVVQRGTDPHITVRLRGALVAQGSSLTIRLPETEVYRVSVEAENSGTYEIGLSYTDRPNPNAPTPLPQIVGVPTPTSAYTDLGTYIQRFVGSTETQGVLSAQAPIHVYTVQGTLGMPITIEMRRVSGTLDPFLILYSPQGQIIAMDDDSAGDGNARLLNVYLPEDGLYTIQVSGSNFFGDYTLRYYEEERTVSADIQATLNPTSVAPYATPVLAPVVNDARLDNHVPVIGSLTRAGDFQRFSFMPTVGQSFTVRAQPYQQSSLSPQIEVFNPDGELIASARASTSRANGAAVAANIAATLDGTYVIIVTGEDNTSGAYTIGYGTGSSVSDMYQGIAESNVQLSGDITQAADRHVWEIMLHPNDALSVAVSPNIAGFDPIVEIATADGAVIYRDDNSGANQAALIRTATITTPATYLLRIYDATGTGVGGYTLLWRYINAAASPTPPPAAAAILTVSDSVVDNQYQFYLFQGRAGQRVRIQVEADGSELDPVAALLDPRGMIIAEADDSNGTLNPSFDVVLPIDGTYSVRVNGYLSSGAFILTVAILL